MSEEITLKNGGTITLSDADSEVKYRGSDDKLTKATKIDQRKVEEFSSEGKIAVYVDNRRTEESYLEACCRVAQEEVDRKEIGTSREG